MDRSTEGTGTGLRTAGKKGGRNACQASVPSFTQGCFLRILGVSLLGVLVLVLSPALAPASVSR